MRSERPVEYSESIRDLGRYRSFLHLQAMGLVSRFQSRMDASDLVQQTMMEAHVHLEQFRGRTGAEMAKWLSQILANNFADAARAMTRQRRDIRRECGIQPGNESGADLKDWLATDLTSPSQHLYRKEECHRLRQAMEQLPTAQREVVELHHLQGMSLNETAQRTGKTTAAVAGLLFRGLKTLRTLMAS